MIKVEDMPQISFTNDKGNAKAKVRAEQKQIALDALDRITAPYNEHKILTKDGVSVALGYDPLSQQVIWAHYTCTISTNEPQQK